MDAKTQQLVSAAKVYKAGLDAFEAAVRKAITDGLYLEDIVQITARVIGEAREPSFCSECGRAGRIRLTSEGPVLCGVCAGLD